MGNLVRKSIESGSSITIPGGVTEIIVETSRTRSYMKPDGFGFLDNFGNIFMAGPNTNGQLGNGSVSATVQSLTQVIGGLTARFFAGNKSGAGGSQGYNILISSSGLAYSWGFNANGQLGLGDVVVRSSPVAVLRSLVFDKAYLSGTASLFLTPSGDLYSCGVNNFGQLGVGDVTSRSSPVAVLGGLKFGQVYPSGNSDYNIAVDGSGALWGWGYNANGNLGNGNVAARSSPVAVLGGLTAKKVALGGDSGNLASVLILTTSGTLYAMGNNADGQLGVGDVNSRSSPVAVVGVSNLTFVDIGMEDQGANRCWALTNTGALYMWGANSAGELGLGDTNSRSSPVAVLGGLTFSKADVQTAGVNACSTMAVTPAGVLYAWGSNLKGQLGVGDILSRSSPIAVVGNYTFSDFFLGDSGGSFGITSYGVTNSGQLYAWGYNGSGQAGLGDLNARSSPVAVAGASLPTPKMDIVRTPVPVTPGSSYTVMFDQYNAFFGSTNVASGYINSMTLEWAG